MSRPHLIQDHKPSSVDEECFNRVINGSLSPTIKPASTSVRVYMHSDCTDSQYERDVIWQEVVPDACSFARSLGLRLHFIDPYHLLTATIDKEGTAEQNDMAHSLELEGVYDLNMKEIMLCQDISAGLSFITLLGQKYGHRLLKTEIERDDFESLCATIEDPSMKSSLRAHYILDKGTIPQKYILKGPKNISAKWIQKHDELAKTIKKAAKVAFGKDPNKVQNYTLSVNEEEITQGIFNCPNDVNQSCVWFKRQFTDLYDQRPSSDSSLSLYSDVSLGRRGIMEFDSEAVKLLNYLKEARMPARYIGLDSTNIFDFSIKWHKNQGLSPDENGEHFSYLLNFSEKVMEYLKESLKNISDRVESELVSTCYQESLLHARHCKRKLENVKERPVIMESVAKYLDHQLSCESKPLVVYGSSGSGKSSIMASAVKYLSKEEGGNSSKRCCVFRFIGETAVSGNIRSLLESICQQIALAYDYTGSVPADFNKLIKFLDYLISCLPSHNKPLYMILDGLDCLVEAYQGLGLPWLPVKLPPYVRMMVSVPLEVDCRCHLILRSVISDDSYFVKVPTFDLSEAETFLEYFLSLYSLKITSTHIFILQDALKMSNAENGTDSTLTPLYLQTIAFITKHFSAALFQHQDQLINTCSAINLLLNNVEQTHGKAFVSTTLGLITASQYGMAEDELLDILSCHKNVLSEVQLKCTNLPLASIPIQQVPQIIWSSFLHLLYPSFLRYRMSMGGVWVLQWSSREVHEIAVQRYQQFIDTDESIVDYFSGEMAKARTKEQQPLITVQGPLTSENAKAENVVPVTKHEATNSEITNIPPPALIRPINNQKLRYDKDVYNLRKMTELPYAMHKTKQYSSLSDLAFDYDFLQGNVEMRLLDNILTYLSFLYDPIINIEYDPGHDDSKSFSMANEVSRSLSMKKEVSLLCKALSLSMDNLKKMPAQLSMEMFGRLSPFAMNGNEWPLINNLLITAVSEDLPCLIPLQSYSKFPRENLLLSMNGHFKAITQVDSTIVRISNTGSDEVHEEMVIVSSSMDGKLRTWDWHGSGTLKTFDGHSGPVWCAAIAKNGQYMVSGGEDKTVRFWHVADATCVHVLKGHRDSVKGVCIAKQSVKVVSASLDSTIKVWNTDQSSSCKGQLLFTLNPSQMAGPRQSTATKPSPVHSVCLCKNDTELVCGLGNGTVVIVNILAGEIVRSFKVSTGSVSSIAIAQMNATSTQMSDRRFMIAVSDSAAHLCCYDTGEHISSTLCRFPRIYGKLASWNQLDIFSRIPESLLDDSSTTTFSYANLGALGITGSEDGTICVWDLEKPETPRFAPPSNGLVSAIACSQCGKYISTAYRCGSNPVIKIWQLNDLTGPYASLKLSDQIAVSRLEFFESNRLICSHVDGVIRIWNIDTKQIEGEFSSTGSEQDHVGPDDVQVTCFGISLDHKVLSVGTKHGDISIWNLDKKSKLSRQLEGHAHHPIVSILFTHQYIITADESGRVIIRDYKTLDIINQLESGNDAKLKEVRLSSPSSILAGVYTDDRITIWSLPKLQKVTEFTVNYGTISSIGFIRDKVITTSVNSVDDSGCVQIWDGDICVGMCVTDSGITTATSMPIGASDGLILYGCEDGNIGVYLYNPQWRTQSHDGLVRKLLEMHPRPKSTNSLKLMEDVCTRVSRSTKETTSKTTLHSLKEVENSKADGDSSKVEDAPHEDSPDSHEVVGNVVKENTREERVVDEGAEQVEVDSDKEKVISNETSVQTSTCVLL